MLKLCTNLCLYREKFSSFSYSFVFLFNLEIMYLHCLYKDQLRRLFHSTALTLTQTQIFHLYSLYVELKKKGRDHIKHKEQC